MKRIVREYNVYSFSELSKVAKEKVIQEFKNDEELSRIQQEFYKKDMTELIKLLGFNVEDFSYSLNFFQGDVTSFVTSTMYCEEVVKMLENFKNGILKEKGYKMLSELMGVIHQRNDFSLITDENMQLLKDFDFYFAIERTSHRYSHEFTIDIDVPYLEGTKEQNTVIQGIEKLIIGVARTIMKEMEKIGYEWLYDDFMNEEEVKENCECNEYTFLEDGTMFNE